jgi:hypothetical protein
MARWASVAAENPAQLVPSTTRGFYPLSPKTRRYSGTRILLLHQSDERPSAASARRASRGMTANRKTNAGRQFAETGGSAGAPFGLERRNYDREVQPTIRTPAGFFQLASRAASPSRLASSVGRRKAKA